MKKSVAIGIAGVAAVVVAAWRQVQRDNTLPDDGGLEGESATPVSARPPARKDTGTRGSDVSPATDASSAASAGALFVSSVSEDSTKAELYEIATEMKIDGRSKMNKSELLAAIRAAS